MRSRSSQRSVTRLAIAFLAATVAHASGATDAEFDALGAELAREVTAQEGVAFAKHFDVDAFASRVFHNFQARDAKDFEAGLRQSFDATIAGFSRQVPKGSTVTFLHHRKEGDEDRLTCRVSGDQGINYWEFIVQPRAGGPTLAVADVYTAVTGETLTQTVQRFFLRMIPPNGKELTQADAQVMTDIKTFSATVQSGDGRGALKQFDALPERFRKDKAMQVMRMMAAARVQDDPTLIDGIADEFKQRFGDDPAADLMLLDSYVNRKRLDACDECLDRIDQRVGGDAFLGAMSVGLHLKADDVPSAKAAAAKWYARHPGARDAIESSLQVALVDKDDDATLRLMREMESSKTFSFRFADDLNNSKDYETFKKSPQYQEWLAGRAAK